MGKEQRAQEVSVSHHGLPYTHGRWTMPNATQVVGSGRWGRTSAATSSVITKGNRVAAGTSCVEAAWPRTASLPFSMLRPTTREPNTATASTAKGGGGTEGKHEKGSRRRRHRRRRRRRRRRGGDVPETKRETSFTYARTRRAPSSP